MSIDANGKINVLTVRAGSRTCVFPLAAVVEVMRPLPAEPLAGMPPFVHGLSIIRGTPVPVVDLGAILGTERSAAKGRFVVLGIDGRRLAVAVDAVLAVRVLAAADFAELPPLLRESCPEPIAAIAALDQQLFLFLEAGRFVPEECWQQLEARAPS